MISYVIGRIEPQWPDRDRIILSKGHGCIALFGETPL